MKNQERTARERGFTLIEMLVVLAILFTAVMLGLPYLMSQIEKSKLIGVASQTSGLMRLARLDAIKYSRRALVAINLGERKVQAFSDVDLDGCPSAADVRLAEVALPKGVSFQEPGGGVDAASVEGFTACGSTPAPVALFQSDGSVESTGSFRFQSVEIGGRSPSYLEVNVQPAATARVAIRKWETSDWVENNDLGAWKWN
jgi:prepilin-type N-terminal cleavage/methylation domain-containing protein